jgi:hypothetical protein
VPTRAVEPSLWEDWFGRATPAQQQEMLTLAASQGVLFRRQLPAVNGLAAPAARPWLGALLGGQAQLAPLPALPPLEPVDSCLDDRQREAVARALFSPDVCLIQGYPGTGKSRVAAEIILQAAQRGERVLLVAPTAAAIDSILERVAGNRCLYALRCLGPEELPDALSPCVHRLTLAERSRVFIEQTLPAAQAQRSRCQQAEEALQPLEQRWPRLGELAGQYERLAARMQSLGEQRAALAAAVEAEIVSPAGSAPSDLQRAWQMAVAAHHHKQEQLQGQQAGFQAERETICGKKEQLERELEQVRPLVDARQRRRWWTGAWWRAVTQDPDKRFAELQSRQEELDTALRRLEASLADCARQQQQLDADLQLHRQSLLEEEVSRRQAELERQLAGHRQEQQTLQQEWDDCFAGSCLSCSEVSSAALEAARQRWQELREQARSQTQEAEVWLAAVEEAAAPGSERLLEWVNLLAATTAAVLAGAVPQADRAEPFDLLVLDETHQVTESELLGVARHARRWVLLGEPSLDEDTAVVPSRTFRPAALRPGHFHRLWQLLHADPRRLPASWHQRKNRLVCRLIPIAVGQEPFLESEPLADRPEIELRILAAPRQTPQLAEVIFPPGTTLVEAKSFLCTELGELPVQAAGPCLHWRQTPSHLVVDFAACLPVQTAAIALDRGIRETVGARPGGAESDGEGSWRTWQLEFDREAGWTMETAQQWLADRLHLRDLGRTAMLTRPYRGQPGLVRFLSDLLFEGVPQPALPSSPRAEERVVPVVEFVPVPTLAPADTRRSGEADASGRSGVSRLRGARSGAGLELDLSDSRPLEQLPPDLRTYLPAQGLVNFLEAQAVLKKLEGLAADPLLQTAGLQWQLGHALHPLPSAPSEGGKNGTGDCAAAMPVIAVMAPYPAQVELIRLLIQRSPVLAQSLLPIEVGLPRAFQQRECLVALLSLTRSHSHRPVCYGDSPELLVQALTRSAGRLILFGDPATLLRRSQWQGALDHLDERSAQQERRLLGHLVRYLQGHGTHPGAFHFHEGCGV